MNNPRHIPASELAEMGFCEQKVVLASRLGRRDAVAQAIAQQRGLEAHADFHADAKEVIARGGKVGTRAADRCFIATAVYGANAPETWALRDFRDQVLLASAIGRALVEHYYRASPAVAAWLRRHALAASLVRCGLNRLTRIARYLAARRRQS